MGRWHHYEKQTPTSRASGGRTFLCVAVICVCVPLSKICVAVFDGPRQSSDERPPQQQVEAVNRVKMSDAPPRAVSAGIVHRVSGHPPRPTHSACGCAQIAASPEPSNRAPRLRLRRSSSTCTRTFFRHAGPTLQQSTAVMRGRGCGTRASRPAYMATATTAARCSCKANENSAPLRAPAGRPRIGSRTWMHTASTCS